MRGLVGGLVVTGAPLAFVVVSLIQLLVLDHLSPATFLVWGWRIPFIVGAVLGVLYLIYFWCLVPEIEMQELEPARQARRPPLAELIRGPQAWPLAQVVMLMTGMWFASQMTVSFQPVVLITVLHQAPGQVSDFEIVSGLITGIGMVLYGVLASGSRGCAHRALRLHRPVLNPARGSAGPHRRSARSRDPGRRPARARAARAGARAHCSAGQRPPPGAGRGDAVVSDDSYHGASDHSSAARAAGEDLTRLSPARAPAGRSVYEPPRETPVHVVTDVLVVGGGPAGCEAALAARRLGAEVILVEERYNDLGGLSTGGLVIWIDRMTDRSGRQVIAGVGSESLERLPAEAMAGAPEELCGSTDRA
jgi:hypothetical protein